MKPKARFIASIVAAAEKEQVQMPWARGSRRAAFIARRNGQATEKKVKLA